MNVIANDCIGGYYYTFKKEQNDNPFIYHAMTLSNFIKLIENYDKINFNNVSFKILKVSKIFPQNKNTVQVNIDDKIIFEFIHHMFKKGVKKPTAVKQQNAFSNEVVRNLFYENIIDYLKEKYFLRLNRMKEEPIFVFHDNSGWTDININNILNVNTDRKIFIFTTNKEIKSNKENIKFIKTPKRLKPEDCAKKIIKEKIFF